MIHPDHLRDLIIDPTLKYLDMYSGAASNLMIGTCAQESHLGHFLMQVDHLSNPVGPALGIYQMEPATAEDIFINYLDYGSREVLRNKVVSLRSYSDVSPDHDLICNLRYSTAMARLKYWRDSEPLPDADDIEGLARVYKRVYNTRLGKATEKEFIANYRRFVSGVENV